MAFVEIVTDEQATPMQEAAFAAEREQHGYVPAYARLFARRPEVHAAWEALMRAARSGADARRYEVATLGAARGLRSSYCSLAHGRVLADRIIGAPAVAALLGAGEPADEEARRDAAVAAFAETVARSGTAVTRSDVERLRSVGLTEDEVIDVVMIAAARCFFSTALDALGVQPDAEYRELLSDELRDLLTVGRPIAD